MRAQWIPVRACEFCVFFLAILNFRKPLFSLSFLIGCGVGVQVYRGRGWIDFPGSGRYGLDGW